MFEGSLILRSFGWCVMVKFEQVSGSWPALADRLDARGVLGGWTSAEPVLGCATSVHELVALTAVQAPAWQRHAIVDALVRLAAVTGGGDADAAMVVLHLMTPGALRLCRRLASSLGPARRGLAAEVPQLVVGSLMVQIRAFPVDRRPVRCAAKLLWLTLDAVTADLAVMTGRRESAVEPWQLDVMLQDQSPPVAGPSVESADVDAWELLAWAQDTGVVSAGDAGLLRALLVSQHRGGHGARLRVAAEHGISERTVRRQRDRAVAALHDARLTYLDAA